MSCEEGVFFLGIFRSVSPGGEASVTFSITAKNDVEPTRTLTVTFESTQLEGVMGSAVIRVKN